MPFNQSYTSLVGMVYIPIKRNVLPPFIMNLGVGGLKDQLWIKWFLIPH